MVVSWKGAQKSVLHMNTYLWLLVAIESHMNKLLQSAYFQVLRLVRYGLSLLLRDRIAVY